MPVCNSCAVRIKGKLYCPSDAKIQNVTDADMSEPLRSIVIELAVFLVGGFGAASVVFGSMVFSMLTLLLILGGFVQIIAALRLWECRKSGGIIALVVSGIWIVISVPILSSPSPFIDPMWGIRLILLNSAMIALILLGWRRLV